MKKLDVKRFNAFVGYTRQPHVRLFCREVDWYSNDDETVLAVLLLDYTDNDYSVVVLGRDLSNRFRAISLNTSIRSADLAEKWLTDEVEKQTHLGPVFPQGDEKNKAIDLFAPLNPPEKLHPYFIHLSKERVFVSARRIISEMMPHYKDIDGNFAQQFQTDGFDSRLWELYLNAYFNEENLLVDRSHEAPDFVVSDGQGEAVIEAVIVGRKNEINPPQKEFVLAELPKIEKNEYDNAMPIRFGSSLYSKLQKRYWELNHVKGKALIFAIADFHNDYSMTWSQTSLITYLYGAEYGFHLDENNRPVYTSKKIESHADLARNKTIPSGFFFQPDAENISAVLFSSTGTISKFNRLGRQAGFGAPEITMIRRGFCHDHTPDTPLPKFFAYEVTEATNESWAEGLAMFHNPNALHKTPKIFPSIAHFEFREGKLVGYIPDFHPYMSMTFNIQQK
jgi:hypothetical protein